jgi:putative phosphoribosyl transferase
MKKFADRRAAGRELAEQCRTIELTDPVVLGLPRGGVVVAFEVARALRSQLDVLVVRKLGHPHQRELALGAIGEHGVRAVNEEILRRSGVSVAQLGVVEASEQIELARRVLRYRGDDAPIDIRQRAVIIVDDGIATGATMAAAVAVARRLGVRTVVVATPVMSDTASEHLADAADLLISLRIPKNFWAVGDVYRDFVPTQDDEVLAVLGEARERQ